MSPTELQAYLATLPRNAFQIELTSGDFTIKLNIAPALADAKAGTVADPRELFLHENFPHLVKGVG